MGKMAVLQQLLCDSCGHETEARVGDEVVKCPCGEPMRIVPAGGSFALNGSGWYRDGYKGGA